MMPIEHFVKFVARIKVYPDTGTMFDSRLDTLDERKKTSTPINILYTTLGLCGEAGKLANKVKKIYRDKKGIISPEDRLALSDELGDCAWYIAATCNELGLDLETVLVANMDKLRARKAANTIKGSGDNR